ncbi:glucuronate isomerase [Salinisphaera sp. G21_0]|uniref:glucuronate isomerase n=1 Tax=Salinisphaera sp. G21_0 TaxID=2821094 RepID=UPI001ADC1879|nr:glucuronate isomerase [Salinisphaera sp. G21_0]MBO9482908.1 glucuronate isomerase [Salinisphaera sp. G21_0]
MFNKTSNQSYRPHPDRLFSSNNSTRSVARALYQEIRHLPIISPHGHTDPAWFADNQPFGNPAALFLQPDHYAFRMLHSQGISLESIGIKSQDPFIKVEQDPRKAWQIFADNYFLFRGTPTRMWMDHAMTEVLGADQPLNSKTAQGIYDHIDAQLKTEAFLPRSLYERFNIEVLATTETAVDTLKSHLKINASDWQGRVITTFRPDSVTDPYHPDFSAHMALLAEQTGEDVHQWSDYLTALRKRRAFFQSTGATATDHSYPTPYTTVLSEDTCQLLLTKALAGEISAEEAQQFCGHMLVEMARMSQEDGLVMQIHCGVYRNHNQSLLARFGADKGADIPLKAEFVHNLRPLLNEVGNDPNLTIILFTLDEDVYARELAPLAGHYPALKLGPAWWFHDSPEGMMRYRRMVTETAGFYNTVGFNDDTRAFLSIPARHDVARRVDCNFLASLVCEHRITEEEAFELAHELTSGLARKAYRL